MILLENIVPLGILEDWYDDYKNDKELTKIENEVKEIDNTVFNIKNPSIKHI